MTPRRGDATRRRAGRHRARLRDRSLRPRDRRRFCRVTRVRRARSAAPRVPDRVCGVLRRSDAVPRLVGLPARAARGRSAFAPRALGTGATGVRVLHVHRMRGIGGSERHLLTLLPALAERGIDPLFLGLDDPTWDASDFYDALRVPAIRIPAPRDLDPLLLARVVRASRADIVHTHL